MSILTLDRVQHPIPLRRLRFEADETRHSAFKSILWHHRFRVIRRGRYIHGILRRLGIL